MGGLGERVGVGAIGGMGRGGRVIGGEPNGYGNRKEKKEWIKRRLSRQKGGLFTRVALG